MSSATSEQVEEFLPLIEEGRTLQEIGEHFGISRQRVSQVLAQAPTVRRLWRQRREERMNMTLQGHKLELWGAFVKGFATSAEVPDEEIAKSDAALEAFIQWYRQVHE